MPSESSSEVKFEIGHVLFIDIVGYSKLLINEQSEQIQTLREIVRGTEQFRIAGAEGKLLRLPTGDGGALVFRTSPEAPVLCALEISKELRNHPELHVRMGIHSGPVNEVVDLNEQSNIAGAGINMAQRVMDCGDAGHILLSKRVADDLEHYPQWRSRLHELGECEVKHGVRVSLVNLYTDELGNSEVPEKFRRGEAVRADEGFWVAVLPFKYSGSNSDLTALAEGLSEDIITGLSRFSYLRVIARTSTARFAQDSGDVRAIGKELGARYVMEGGVRQAGSILRITVQLVDTTSGAHLWAESYDRVFEPKKIFTLVDDVVPRIVATVADMHGVLLHTMSEALRGKKPESLTPYEAVLRSFGYIAHLSVEEHAKVRACLELAFERAPENADVLAMLSNVYAEEYKQGFNVLPESLERALNAARRSVDAAPSNSLSYHMLAQALFFRREFEAFRNAAERAIALNPMDTCTAAFMGILLAYSGEWERGCALTRRAMELNPNHPGWYRFAEFNDAYRKKDYRGALDVAVRFNMPSYYFTHAVLAAAAGQLGDRDTARRALRELLAQVPAFATSAREDFAKWLGHGELLEHVLDGLRKAGLDTPDNGLSDSPKRSATFRDNARRLQNTRSAAPSKSVAVLPFVNLSADRNDEYLSDGMTEQLINSLAKVPGLRVPGRTSCFAFKGRSETDIFRKVGDQLHVNTVLEGSVRKAGEKLRVTAQLINVSDGYHLWSKDYDGDVKDILNFQSNVAKQVVQALQVHLGAEAARALIKKPTENPEAHRLYLLGRYEFGKYTQAGWNNAIRYYEQALKLDPEYALAYCGLADNYAYMGSAVMPGEEANTKVKEFAQKALELDPELAEAHMSLALALVAFAFDWRNGLKEFDRALELNPNLAFAYELQAWTVNGLGRFDEAIAKTKKAIELDPLNPFFQMSLSFFQYWARQYDDSIAQSKKTLAMDPNSAISHVLLGLSLFKKGDAAGAIAEFQRAKAPNPGAWYQGYLGYTYAISGDRVRAKQALHELEGLEKRQYVSPTALATIYLGLGEKEKCFDWLEKAYEEQDSACWYLKIDQIYDSVRKEPRFQALVEKIFHETQ